MNKLFLISIALLFFSCKKNKIKKIERNFLCEIHLTQSYTGQNSITTFDNVLAPKVVDDNILFEGYEFPLSEYDRKTGSGSYTITENSNTIKLAFSNGFEEISFSLVSTSTLSGPSSTKVISGTSTDLELITESNPLFSQSGSYNLNVQKLKTTDSIDTTYAGLFPVSYDPLTQNLDIDGEIHSVPRCYSYYNRVENYNQGSLWESVINDLDWSDNTLHYNYFRSISTSSNGDTTNYVYQGSM